MSSVYNVISIYFFSNETYFTSDVDAKDRIRSLNEFNKINLNEMRRTSVHDDGKNNDCHEYDPLREQQERLKRRRRRELSG